METFFHPHDPRYAWIALAIIAIDRRVLKPRLSPLAWYWLRWPAIFVHELTHAVVCGLLGSSARFGSLRPRLVGGEVEGGRVDVICPLGGVGLLLSRLAPLALYLAAGVLASWVMGQPQTLGVGLAWLALLLTMLEAAQLISPGDLHRIGPVWLPLLVCTALGAALAACHGQALICETTGLICHGGLLP